jgi:hypothetical protein
MRRKFIDRERADNVISITKISLNSEFINEYVMLG